MTHSCLDDAIQFLIEGNELGAAELLRACALENYEAVDSWMDGPRQLDGILLEVACPRLVYDILSDDNDPRTKSIINAFSATFPSDRYLKRFRARAASGMAPMKKKPDIVLTDTEMKDLITVIENQKASMIAVATGGPRINDVNPEYNERREKIRHALEKLSVSDPNPYVDLWAWYGKWSDGSLPTYQSRRRFIADLYQPLLEILKAGAKAKTIEPPEPTGWARVDRNVEKIIRTLERAKNEEDFQAVALLCRESIISLAQAVYDPEKHEPLDGVPPSPTDAKRMLENFIAVTLKGHSYDYQRKFAKAAFDLTVNLQHRRTAAFRDAALCAEATRSIINVIAIISGQRDPNSENS